MNLFITNIFQNKSKQKEMIQQRALAPWRESSHQATLLAGDKNWGLQTSKSFQRGEGTTALLLPGSRNERELLSSASSGTANHFSEQAGSIFKQKILIFLLLYGLKKNNYQFILLMSPRCVNNTKYFTI